ncbi:Bystin-domain-containing protein [Tricharina praecox]|uniref:Bystin-domain-containing protein n=1 Tax=Tricharina praecox TaxID=43433 RepID=UPI0022202DAA|nr:Bystin-domain-containing protein [Tricharina praecox]KAI5854412.1 Bystin-domain-containing protein [Tricharina praecox]
MPKDTMLAQPRAHRRHNPLHEELLETSHGPGHLRKVARIKRKEKQDRPEDYVDSGLSKRILLLAKEQQDEISEERAAAAAVGVGAFIGGGGAQMRIQVQEEEEDSDEGEFDDDDGFEDEEEEVEEIEVDEGDEELFNRFMPQEGQQEQRVSLADKILEKIAEHEAKLAGGGGQGKGQDDVLALPPKVVEVYTKVGILLSRYKSGKLPKAFKIIPSLKNWEPILFITRPDKWTPNACYEAMKLFAAQKSSQTQKFLSLILLDRVRDEIHESKKLNVHLYNSIKKSLYKPAAFFKGFLFPLAESGTCSLKEAQIIGSVLTRISIPVLHSAAALLRLCEMDYTGPTSVFIQVLIDKKYALPYKVVDGLVFHFIRFKSVDDQLPLLWHKSLLAFAERYRNDITEDQRDALLDLLLVKGHPLVGPEIRRQLIAGRARGMEKEMMMMQEDDLMME